MRILTTIETIWFNAVLLASPNWTSHVICEDVASLLHTPSVWAVLMSVAIRLIKDNGPLEVAHAHIDDD